MLNSLHACGTTLLDTINHVMDYAKISESRKGVSSRRLKNSNTIRLSSKSSTSRRERDPAFGLSLTVVEVLEAVFSGSSYVPVTFKLLETPGSPATQGSVSFHDRKVFFIVLDVAHEDDWVYSFPIGSWRRMVMVSNIPFDLIVRQTLTSYLK